MAPAMVGAPTCGLSPPSISTSPNSTMSPGSRSMPSILILSSAATRYCLPPVLMTANIVLVLVFDPGARKFRTGFFQSVAGFRLRPECEIQGCNKARGPKGPRTGWLWPAQAKLSRKSGLNRARGAESPYFPGSTADPCRTSGLDQTGQVLRIGFRHPQQNAKSLQPAEKLVAPEPAELVLEHGRGRQIDQFRQAAWACPRRAISPPPSSRSGLLRRRQLVDRHRGFGEVLRPAENDVFGWA